jgi:hypothetical protein
VSTILLDPKDPEVAELSKDAKPGETVEAIIRFTMPKMGDGPTSANITETVSMECLDSESDAEEGETEEAPGGAPKGKMMGAMSKIMGGNSSRAGKTQS